MNLLTPFASHSHITNTMQEAGVYLLDAEYKGRQIDSRLPVCESKQTDQVRHVVALQGDLYQAASVQQQNQSQLDSNVRRISIIEDKVPKHENAVPVLQAEQQTIAAEVNRAAIEKQSCWFFNAFSGIRSGCEKFCWKPCKAPIVITLTFSSTVSVGALVGYAIPSVGAGLGALCSLPVAVCILATGYCYSKCCKKAAPQ